MQAELIARMLYFSAPLIPFSFIYFVNLFPTKRDWKPFWHFLVLPLSILFISFLSLSPDVLIESVTLRAAAENALEFHVLPYILYSLFVSIAWGVAYISMLRSAKGLPKEKRRPINFMLIGVIVSTIIAVITNLLLPYVGIFALNWVGQAGLVVMVSLVGYALVQYQLFDIKVITAELLTFVIWIVLGARIFFSEDPDARIVNIITFVVVFVSGLLLIRSVKKEVQAKEEMSEMAGNLKMANRRLKKLDNQKSKMLSIASHQFRGPLTSIKGYASLLREGDFGNVPEHLTKPINRIFKSSVDLAHIVDDFLNISRIEQGRMEYSFSEADLQEIIEQVVEEMQPTIEQNDLDLSFEAKTKDAYCARVDAGKFKQVVSNLVDNAIKYTPEGEIVITLSREENRIRVTVEDTGVGISQNELTSIFEQFSRAHNASDVSVIGSGLGLYVAKKIVTAHGGMIWAESDGEGKGSRFIVELHCRDGEGESSEKSTKEKTA